MATLAEIRAKLKDQMPDWADYMPAHLRDYAFKEASQAYKSAIKNLQRHNFRYAWKYDWS